MRLLGTLVRQRAVRRLAVTRRIFVQIFLAAYGGQIRSRGSLVLYRAASGSSSVGQRIAQRCAP